MTPGLSFIPNVAVSRLKPVLSPARGVPKGVLRSSSVLTDQGYPTASGLHSVILVISAGAPKRKTGPT